MRRLIVSLTGLLLVAGAVSAQTPPAPDEVVIPPARTHPPVGKSDQYRIVGKVLDVDQARGVLKLATDEGVVETPAPRMMVLAVRVGETVSVPRDAGSAPGASPR